MRQLFSLLILFFAPLAYFFVAIAISSLAAYPLFFAFDGAFTLFRIISRCAMILMLLGIYPLMRWCRVTGEELGFSDGVKPSLARFGRGFGVGVMIMSFIVITLLLLGVRAPFAERLASLTWIGRELLLALLSGVGVALMEETLFRGLLFGVVKKYGPALYAMVISSLCYSALHFIKSELRIPAEEIGWGSGMKIIHAAVMNLFKIENLNAGTALFLAGFFLAMVRHYIPRSLVLCIGIHAGWVFVIKTTKSFTLINFSSEWLVLITRYDGVIGYLATGWLLFLITLFFVVMQRRKV